MIERIGTPAAGAMPVSPIVPRFAGKAEPAPPVEASPSVAADAGPPIDGAKVEAIRAGLADGSYRLDPAATAKAMLGDQ